MKKYLVLSFTSCALGIAVFAVAISLLYNPPSYLGLLFILPIIFYLISYFYLIKSADSKSISNSVAFFLFAVQIIFFIISLYSICFYYQIPIPINIFG